VDLKNFFPAPDIGQGNHHLAVKAARPQQGWIQHVRTVGSSDDDDARMAFETVHFHQQLIQGLFPFVVAAAQARTPLPPNRINFINEEDAGRMLLGVFEHVPDPGCPYADKHFHEIGTGNGEKGYLGFPGDSPGQQSLPRPRAAHHEHALGNTASQLLEFGRIFQKIHQFGNFFLGFVAAGHIRKGDAVIGFVQHPGPGFAEGKGAALAAALHLAHEKHPDTDEQQHGEPANENIHQHGGFFFRLGLNPHPALQQVGDQPEVGRRVGSEFFAFGGGGLEHPAFDHYLGNMPLLHLFDELGIINGVLGRLAVVELVEDGHEHQTDHQPDSQVFQHIVQVCSSCRAWRPTATKVSF